jgi:hypothetical protein
VLFGVMNDHSPPSRSRAAYSRTPVRHLARSVDNGRARGQRLLVMPVDYDADGQHQLRTILWTNEARRC